MCEQAATGLSSQELEVVGGPVISISDDEDHEGLGA